MHNINLSKYNLRTDLIIENDHILHEEKTEGNLTITKTKNNGNYITISFNDITDKDNVYSRSTLTSLIKKARRSIRQRKSKFVSLPIRFVRLRIRYWFM